MIAAISAWSAGVSRVAATLVFALRCARDVAPTMTAATPGLDENRAAGDGRHIEPMPVGDPPQRSEQLLKQRPAAEFVDDELVFRQRPIGERAERLLRAEPSVGQESAGDRSVAQEADAMGLAERGEAVFGTAVDERILRLHRDERDAGVENLPDMGRIEIRAADMAHFSVASQIIERSKRVQPARLGVVPPMELHQIERVDLETAQRSVDDSPRRRGD